MANYNSMKKDELIKVLKERDSVIAGFKETNSNLVKEKDELVVKIDGLTRDCEGMTEECNNLRNQVKGLTDDLTKANNSYKRLIDERDNLKVENRNFKFAFEQNENIINVLKRQRVILVVALAIAVIGIIAF